MSKQRHLQPRPLVARLLVIATALAFWACGRASEPAPTAPAQSPPAPTSAPAQLDEQAAPAAAAPSPEPREEEGPRDRMSSEGSFAQPPKDDLSLAEADLERARAELNDALSSSLRRARPASTAGAPAAGSGRAADAAEPAPPAKADKKTAESSCPTACHAFSSLKRAATAVCRLAGEKDGRCSHAHGVVADAEKRVTVCGCSAE